MTCPMHWEEYAHKAILPIIVKILPCIRHKVILLIESYYIFDTANKMAYNSQSKSLGTLKSEKSSSAIVDTIHEHVPNFSLGKNTISMF